MAAAKRVDDKGRKLPDGFSQRPDGRYMARFTHNGKRYTLYDTTLNTLKEKVLKKKYELENGIGCVSSNMTVDQLYTTWIEVYYKNKVRPRTIELRERMYRLHIKDEIGTWKVQNIKPVDVRNLCTKKYETVSFKIAKNVQTILHLMFEVAVENDIIQSNPATNALKHLARPPKKEKHIPTYDETKRFINYVSNSEIYRIYKPFFVVAFNTGMRCGELCGLTWNDVDFENNCISVNRSLSYTKKRDNGKCEIIIGPPKTATSKRKIPMTSEVKEALKEQKALYDEQIQRKPVKAIEGISNFVFLSKLSTPVTEYTLISKTQKIIERINEEEEKRAEEEKRKPELIEQFTLHAMRHAFATRCFEAGMSPKTVQGLLGHANISMTMDIYTHLTEQQKNIEIGLLENMKIVGK